MKKLKLSLAGGMPMKSKALETLQLGSLEVLKALIMHMGLSDTGNYIISGCEILGTKITSGLMYINDDLCPFVESNGDLTTKIAKIKTTEDAPYKNGNNNPLYEDYSALINASGTPLSDFVRVPKVKEMTWSNIENKPAGIVLDPNINTPEPSLIARILALESRPTANIPIGMIAIWDRPANEIPNGWQEYVGLKGRMPIGLDPNDNDLDALGIIGGSKSKKLELENLPKFRPHFRGSGDDTDSRDGSLVNTNNKEENGGIYGDEIGGDVPFSLLNPYRVVHFIKYVGL
jgi:hypothetical protein